MKTQSGFFLYCIALLCFGCGSKSNCPKDLCDVNFRDEMRKFVTEISVYGKGKHPGFLIVPQNGQELFTDNSEGNGVPFSDYLANIDGTGREDLRYGYTSDDKPTPDADFTHMKALLQVGESKGVEALVIDYCSTPSKMQDAYTQNAADNFISFSADHRELDNIPSFPTEPFQVNTQNITNLSQAKNFLYLINPEQFATKQAFITAVQNTNYDAVVMDLFFNDETLTAADLQSLKTKQNGGTRILLCYMSIGEAENYRYYWQTDWKKNPPLWLDQENPLWKGNYKVRYWLPEWKSIIKGNADSYLDKILDAGFDGVYLDIVDGFEYFEAG